MMMKTLNQMWEHLQAQRERMEDELRTHNTKTTDSTKITNDNDKNADDNNNNVKTNKTIKESKLTVRFKIKADTVEQAYQQHKNTLKTINESKIASNMHETTFKFHGSP